MARTLSRFGLPLWGSPNWFPLLTSLGIWAYLGFTLVPIVRCYQRGKPAMAEVVRYVPETTDDGSRIHRYELAFDGHRSVQRSGRMRKIGDKFPVTYWPGDPESAIKGAKPDSLWSIVGQNTNDVMLGISVAAGSLLLIAGMRRPTKGRSVLSGEPAASGRG